MERPAWEAKLAKYFLIPQRYILGIMGLLAVMNAYTMRITLSVAITEMVAPPNETEQYNPDACHVEGDKNTTATVTNPTSLYNWDEHIQGIILSSFYWGYPITRARVGSDHGPGRPRLGLVHHGHRPAQVHEGRAQVPSALERPLVLPALRGHVADVHVQRLAVRLAHQEEVHGHHLRSEVLHGAGGRRARGVHEGGFVLRLRQGHGRGHVHCGHGLDGPLLLRLQGQNT